MLKNYLISAYRNLLRSKSYSLLNILGLALGIGCSIVMFSYIHIEQQTDRYHENFDRIYRTYLDSRYSSFQGLYQVVPHPLGNAIREESASFEKVARIHLFGDCQVSYYMPDDVKHIEQSGVMFSDTDLFDILTVEFIAGSGTIDDLNTVVISRSVAHKIFGDLPMIDVVGRELSFDNKARMTVMGVFEDLPEQTDFPFEVVASYDSQAALNDYFGKGSRWETFNGSTTVLLLLEQGASPAEAERQVTEIYRTHRKIENTDIYLQPLSEVHYNGEIGSWAGVTLSRELLWTLRLIAILLVITSSINFINLSTAKATTRSKEVGVRKVMGSSISQLVRQMLTETFIIVAISTVIGLALSELIFQFVNTIVNKSMSLVAVDVVWLIGFCLTSLILITVLSGIYPAILVARFQPIAALKSQLGLGNSSGKFNLRRLLVIVQFTISMSLLSGAYVAINQHHYMVNQDMGFKQEGVISIPLPKIDSANTALLKTKIAELAQVETVSAHLGSPLARTNNTGDARLEGTDKSNSIRYNHKNVDEDYFELFDLELLAGRNLRPSDYRKNLVINETAMQGLGIENPEEAIGKKIVMDWGAEFAIVGVTSGFHENSFREVKQAVFFSYVPKMFYELALSLKQVNAASIASTLTDVENVWRDVYPEYLFSYDFVSDIIAKRYEEEMQMTRIIGFFTFIAIVIAGLGLYGLIDYIAIRRVKEIGIRKVLGATRGAILMIFSKELGILLSISAVVSFPVMYFLLEKWLENYAYSIALTPLLFFVVFLIILLVVVATSSYRAFIAASINPAQTLKDE